MLPVHRGELRRRLVALALQRGIGSAVGAPQQQHECEHRPGQQRA